MTEREDRNRERQRGRKERKESVQVMELQNTPSHRRDPCHMTTAVIPQVNHFGPQ